jgi:glycosyltransferase involved in cell wall biosynthesis
MADGGFLTPPTDIRTRAARPRMNLSHRLYYTFKPYTPWILRMVLRRWRAQRLRVAHQATWPIDEAAGQPPVNWPGWPENKAFAFAITHDVEGPEGLAKVRQLAEVECELGFRSSFNFIPEGEYRVTPELRAWLTAKGFEVGVHDLNHDGKLYSSHDDFRLKAARINDYLKEWNAVGYRSGFMLRNRAWHHELQISYDATSFDTDPFEPIPEGARTIFPFWVDRLIPKPKVRGRKSNAGQANPDLRTPIPGSDLRPPTSEREGVAPKGFVELPYTLPQDSTLFLVLREKGPTIWLKKLDWLARQGGMALVNVHPDYLAFGNDRSMRSFPVAHYRELLQHVARRHAGSYWHALPREISAWYTGKVLSRQEAPTSVQTPSVMSDRDTSSQTQFALKGQKVAVLLYSYYPSDPRPRRAAEAMAEAGATVDLICLRDSDSEKPREQINGVTVRRLPLGKKRGGKLVYFAQYGAFIAACFGLLSWRALTTRYQVVHVHNMPDILAFAALPARLRGARILLDLHDPMPELMTSIYHLPASHWLVALLRTFERWSIGFASMVLTPNITFKKLFTSRSCRPEKMEIVMNSPQPEIFNPDRFPAEGARTRSGEFRIMHHGSIVHRHGIDLLVDAVAMVKDRIPGIRLDIYGGHTSFVEIVLAHAEKHGVADRVHYHGSKTQTEIAEAIRNCDVGVVPNRRSPFTETNFPTRLFEYLAMHRPVIAPSTQGIRDYFTPEQMIYFEPDHVDDLAKQLIWVHDHPDQVAQRVTRGTAVYRQHLWTGEKARLISLTATLAAR